MLALYTKVRFADIAMPEDMPDSVVPQSPNEDATTIIEDDEVKTKPKLVISVNWERTEHVLGALLDAYNNNQFPYNQDRVRLPHDHRHLPEDLPLGGVEHAMFLWSVCYYMRGGIKSVDAVKAMAALYDVHPDLFVAEKAATSDPEDISYFLRFQGLGFQNKQIGGYWVENAQRLHQRWGGDPRNIFNDVDSYEECIKRVKNDGKGGGFLGFREKMTSMIIYYLMDEALIDPFQFPIPVDLHVLRVTVANELLQFENVPEDGNVLSEDTLSVVRKLYYDYAVKHAVSPLRLCDAVWLLSSNLCGVQPGNVTLEPEGRKNRNGRSSVLVPLPIDFNNPKQLSAYARTCAHCPAEPTCEWNVPGKFYYVSGLLVRKDRRQRFPEYSPDSLLGTLE